MPFNDLRRHWAPHLRQLEAVVTRVLRSGWFLLGPETEAFEDEFASFCGVLGSVAVGNGTDALELALRAVDCGPGDEVVVAPNAGMYAATAVLAIGAKPVFADVDPVSLVVTSDTVAAAISDRTTATVVTHLYGNVADVESIQAQVPALRVVEDCAQAHGARLRGRPVGSIGDAAAFSFYPTKNLGAVGDAGAVVSNRPEVLDRARSLRQYGWRTTRYIVTDAGGRNSRIDEIQAAVLRESLSLVEEWNERRAAVRKRYLHELGDRLRFVGSTAPGAESVAHLCVARSSERDGLLQHLRSVGVRCEVHYPVPDYRQPVLLDRLPRQRLLVESERACEEVISLPCFASLRDDEVDRVVAAVMSYT